MEILSGMELSRCLKRCSKYENYRAGVAVADPERRQAFLEEMKRSNGGWSVNVRNGVIRFKNGSTILVFSMTNKGRYIGRRFNEILVDDGIDSCIVESVFDPMLTPYVEGNFISDVEDDDMIDAFLRTFKIIDKKCM